MSDAISIGRNIKAVRTANQMTQREVCEASGISPSQLSAYENGKQMIGLTTLGKIATALGTSIDHLYYGSPSEAFLNASDDFGQTVVNCFFKLWDLGVIGDIAICDRSQSVRIEKCAYELYRLRGMLRDFESKRAYYPNGQAFLSQLLTSTVNEINARYPDDKCTGEKS